MTGKDLTKRGTIRLRSALAGGARKGSGPKQKSYIDRYTEDPRGSGVIRLSNATLAYFERIAAKEGLSAKEYLERQETDSRIL